MHRQHRLRALCDGGLGGLRVEVQRNGVNVGEHGPRALINGGIGRSHERERTGDHLIPSLHANGSQRQMQPSRPTAHGTGTRRPHARGKQRSNSSNFGPSDNCPDRSTSNTAASSASPSTGLAKGIVP